MSDTPTPDAIASEVAAAEPQAARRPRRRVAGLEARQRRQKLIRYTLLFVSAVFMVNALVGDNGLLVSIKARRAYDTAEHPFHDRPFPEVREALRGYLAQRALEQAVARWVDGLKQRVPYRVLVGY